MNTLSPFLSLPSPCCAVLESIREQLSQAGLRSVQTFDLHAARLGSHGCACPNHGTNECDCQMIVLLVYGETDEPVTLILHGNDGKTWISAPDRSMSQTHKKLLDNIQQVLKQGESL